MISWTTSRQVWILRMSPSSMGLVRQLWGRRLSIVRIDYINTGSLQAHARRMRTACEPASNDPCELSPNPDWSDRMGEPTRRIKGLGEIALRVADLDAMQRFYQEVVGLELLRRFDHAAFFRIADGYGGHTQVLALFDRSGQADYRGLDPERTTVDHLAFEIDLADY